MEVTQQVLHTLPEENFRVLCFLTAFLVQVMPHKFWPLLLTGSWERLRTANCWQETKCVAFSCSAHAHTHTIYTQKLIHMHWICPLSPASLCRSPPTVTRTR